MDNKLRNYLVERQEIQFVWKPKYEGSNGVSYSSKHSIFANSLHRHYEAPCGINQSPYYWIDRDLDSKFGNQYDTILNNP